MIKFIILIGFSLLLPITSALAADFQNPSIVGILNILGIVVTSMAFLIGCYFAYRAVNAYEHVREIEAQIKALEEMKAQLTNETVEIRYIKDDLKETKVQLINEVNEIKNIQNETFTSIASTADLLFQNIDEILMNTNLGSLDTRMLHDRELITRSRSQLFYLPSLPKEKRITYLQFLITFGNQSDLEKLNKVIDDTSENDEIRNLTKTAYKMIQQRINREKSNNHNPV